ncbi:hypothetical protein RI054_03g15670 [Pseudoscourfieldia marina]
MAELRLLWRVLDLNGINLLTEYINTKENVHADALSRLDDEEDAAESEGVSDDRRRRAAFSRPVRDGIECATTAVQFALGAAGRGGGKLARAERRALAQREELVQPAVESASNIGRQVGAVGRRSYRRDTGLAEGELGSEARRPRDRGHADPGSHRAVHPGPTTDGTRGRSASLGRRGISHTTATAPAFVIPRRRVAPRVQRQYKRIAPGDPDGLTDWIGQSLSAGSYRTYGGTWRMFQKYCDEAGVRSLPATSYTVACYLKWLGERGTVQKKSLKPYLSVINTVHKDLGYRQRPAIGALVKSMKQPTGASSIALLPLTGVAFALGSELGIQRSYVKTAPDACDFDVPGRRTVSWPVTATWQTLGRMLIRYDRMRRRVCSRATHFFNLGEKARGDAFARWLPVALRAVGAAAPPNGHYAPKSFRSGFASAVTAMNVSPDRRNYIAGWAANSHAVGTHYVDNVVVVDDAARFLFGHLIGLPPPPVEVPVAPVAPWSSPLANLASRLVTLVSPLRGDT